VIGTIVVGVCPNVFLTSIHMSVHHLVELIYF
jgi:hypothetical protein